MEKEKREKKKKYFSPRGKNFSEALKRKKKKWVNAS